MISCDNVKRELSAFLEGTLAPGDSSLIEEHLASCQSCRQVVSQVELIINRMHSVSPVLSSADFDQRLRERIIRLDQSSSPSMRWRSTWSYGLSGAAILVAVYMFVSVQLSEPPVQMQTSKTSPLNVRQTAGQNQPEQFATSKEVTEQHPVAADSVKPAETIEERNINLIEK